MPNSAPSTDTLSIPVLLRHARDTYGAAIRSSLSEAGFDDLPRNGHYVIGGLALPSGGRPLSQLIDELGISKQSAGQLVDVLVVRGYLKREVDDEDRRKLTIGLTARGRAAGRVLGSAREGIDEELTKRAGVQTVDKMRRALALLVEIGRELHASSDD